MADKQPQQPTPTGRARGRARGVPRTAEEARAGGVRKPGEVPAPVAAPPSLQAGNVTPAPQGRGRGLSVEREATGRAYHRGSAVSGSSDLSSSLSGVTLSGTGDRASGPGAAGSTQSLGRGATRGRRDRLEPCIIRTKPTSVDAKQGAGGREINLASNYFELIAKPNWRLLQYRVDMRPDVENTKVRKALMYHHKEQLPKFLFDGTMIFSTTRLNQDDQPIILNSKKNDGTMVVITIKLVGEVTPTDYHYVQFFNIVLRQAMEKMGLSLVRRDYYDPESRVLFNAHKLEVWPGYVTSIRQHESKILLCCEVGNKVLRTDTVLDQITEIFKKCGTNTAMFRSSVEKALMGCIVMTRYNNLTYRIDGVEWDKNPLTEFDKKNGEKTSLVKYYAEKYQKTLRDLKQPLIISVPKLSEQRQTGENPGPLYLVPELCNMTGLSEEQRANFRLMADLGKITRQGPEERSKTLQKFSNRLNGNPNIRKELEGWNLAFSKELVEFRSRILDPEQILGSGSSKATYQMDNADWSSAFRKWNQTSVMSCSKWAIINNPKDVAVTKQFIESMQKAGTPLGMKFGAPKVVTIADNRPATYVQALNQLIPMKPSIVMIIIPNNKGEHYAALKKVAVIENPIPSQCVTSTVLNKPKGMLTVATKVALQMNCKMGGEPWAVKMPLKDTMVIGYDTYHDTAKKGRSVGAIVATMNQTLTRYMSLANMHTTTDSAQELHDNLCPNILKMLRKYNDLNGQLPARIILYRDGVGDGQISYVVDHEVKAIKECFVKAGISADELKFTYVIVSKRINTRFFKTGSPPANPPSGTVVDDVVTLPERYDFFLVSQSVRQGTVNPTSYNVIEDTSGLKPEHLQKLTYKLTHLYYNWPGTVRVPAPCQYAHKLALLVGESLHKEPGNKMEDLLYYL